MQHCYLSPRPRSIISGSVQNEMLSTNRKRCLCFFVCLFACLLFLAEHSQKHIFNRQIFTYLQFASMNTLYSESFHSET